MDVVANRIQLREFVAPRFHVVSREELIWRGFRESSIDSWIRREWLVPLFRGVYSFGRDVESTEAVWRAALLTAGPGAALAGRSAMEHWGAVRAPPRIPISVEVATPLDRAGLRRGLSPALRHTGIQVVRRTFDPADVRKRNGLDVFRAALALNDFAVNAPELQVKFAFLELCRLRFFGKSDVTFSYDHLVGKRGALKVKPLLGLWVPELNQVKSVLEGMYLLRWLERRLAVPEVNAKVFGREVDFLWRREGVGLELDGDAFHTDPIAKQRDLEKTRYLESKGLTVLRATWKVFVAYPDAVIDRVLRELGRL
jgi:hypothetical protein